MLTLGLRGAVRWLPSYDGSEREEEEVEEAEEVEEVEQEEEEGTERGVAAGTEEREEIELKTGGQEVP